MCQLGLKVTYCSNANLFMWWRALCAAFRPILLGRRLSVPIHRKANRRRPHRFATRPTPIIYSHCQLFIEGVETAFFVSAERNKKSLHVPTGTTPGLSRNRRCRNWRWQTQCCLHLQGEAWGGSWVVASTLCAQGPVFTSRDETDFFVWLRFQEWLRHVRESPLLDVWQVWPVCRDTPFKQTDISSLWLLDLLLSQKTFEAHTISCFFFVMWWGSDTFWI